LTALASGVAAGFFALYLRALKVVDTWWGTLGLCFTPAIYIASTSPLPLVIYKATAQLWGIIGVVALAGAFLVTAVRRARGRVHRCAPGHTEARPAIVAMGRQRLPGRWPWVWWRPCSCAYPWRQAT
jgi:hypothetical protein